MYENELQYKKIKTIDSMGMLHHSHRNFIMIKDPLAQEYLQNIPGRAAIQMSVDPLKMICSCEPDLLQIPQRQDLQQ